MRALSALRYRDFRWLWAGTFCSTGGQWIQQATLGWVVYDLTGSGTLLGAVLGVRAIPMLLFAPVTGVIADRFDRRHALAASQVLVITISLAMASALHFHWLQTWHLFAFSVLAGLGAVFDRTLRATLVFNSVPRSEAGHAVALNSIAFSVMRTIGPGVAGVLIGSVGADLNFTIQAVLYAGVAGCALMANARPPAHSRTHTGVWTSMREGARFVASDPIARMMLLLGLLPPLLLIPSFSALMPVFAVDIFHTGPEGLGLLLSAVGVGGILGGIIAAWASRFDRVGIVQMLALALFAASLIAFALSPTIPMAIVFLTIAGLAEMVHAASHVTTLQMCAPENMRGRVASLLPVFPAFISLGALFAGASADLFGPREVVIVLALLGSVVAALAWWRSAPLRHLRLSRLVGATETR